MSRARGPKSRLTKTLFESGLLDAAAFLITRQSQHPYPQQEDSILTLTVCTSLTKSKNQSGQQPTRWHSRKSFILPINLFPNPQKEKPHRRPLPAAICSPETATVNLCPFFSCLLDTFAHSFLDPTPIFRQLQAVGVSHSVKPVLTETQC